ncbi:MAG: hypothetical protein K6F71_13020 [Ruminococcus sp.]|nr:hypothetical protein [Ruminococcus sp.]
MKIIQYKKCKEFIFGGVIMTLENIMKKYDKTTINKFKDFLFVDVDDADFIVGFLKSNDETKLREYSDVLCNDSGFKGIFLDGNQYIISNDTKEVRVIDTVAAEYAKDSLIEMVFNIDEFIFLIRHKKEYMEWCI